MPFSHTTTASLSNRHCIGRVQSIHSSKCLGLFQQEVAAHLMLKDFIRKATWTYFTIKKPSFWKWAETVGGTKPPTPEMFCCDRNWQRLKRWFIMWNPHTHTHKMCTSEAVGLSKKFLSVAFSLPPFLIFSAVDHVQIAVTCETDQWRGNLGASTKD